MRILKVIVRFFRPTANEVVVAPDPAMVELAEKMRVKRGDTVTAGVAQPVDNPGQRLARNADLAGFVTSTKEDDVISGDR